LALAFDAPRVSFTIKNRRIAEIDFLADPERIAQLDLSELGG
jgi:hypothetical protein